MVRLTVLALCAVGLFGLAQASHEKGYGKAHIQNLDEKADYKCDEEIDNDEKQVLIPEKYKHKKNHKPCGKKLHIKNKKNDKKIKARIVGFCKEDECEDDDIIVTPEAYVQLGAAHQSAPEVKWEFKK